MAGNMLRRFPEEEVRAGLAWPLLKPTPEDLAYEAKPRPLHTPQVPTQQQKTEHPFIRFLQKTFSATLKGVLMGILAFTLLPIPLLSFWQVVWHWPFLTIIALGCILLVIFRRAPFSLLLWLLGGALIVGWIAIVAPLFPFSFWFSQWHWIPLLIGLVVFLFIIWRFTSQAVIAFTIAVTWSYWHFLSTHLLIGLVLTLLCVIARCVYEFLPLPQQDMELL